MCCIGDARQQHFSSKLIFIIQQGALFPARSTVLLKMKGCVTLKQNLPPLHQVLPPITFKIFVFGNNSHLITAVL
jgi:hypothetical protein